MIATLALSLCKLRGMPLLSEWEIEALLRSSAMQNGAEAPVTPKGRIDDLIRQLDQRLLERARGSQADALPRGPISGR